MPITRIDATRVAQVEQLWQRSRHLYQNIAYEDLPAMLNKQIALLGEENGRLWGFLCVQSERRPVTLPPIAANRAYIRAIALAQGRFPAQDVPQLIAAAATLLPTYAPRHMLTVYGDQDWLNRALYHADFWVEEEVQFFALERLQQWQPPPAAVERARWSAQHHHTLDLRPCHADDIAILAYLDAHTFTPLWHFDTDGMRELLFGGRFQVITINSTPVGYMAISYHDDNAHLARLAVHPQWQGQGLSHVLLLDALQDAKVAGINTVMLNTQVDNERAQRLYRAYGFRSTKQIVPVLGKMIGEADWIK